ncbi:uncharacterized protein V6R79_003156 [Siganus canaliculatus]
MTKLFYTLTFCVLLRIPAILCGVNIPGEVTVLEGQSLRIPCHYEPQYASYVKYWCQGRMREFCTSLARTDDPVSSNPVEDKVNIFDDPTQLVFTVTMNNLKEADSGWYMCGVELGGMWTADDTIFTHIKVVHGMSAVNSQVSGEEGSSVTVECLYSERYRESEKKWCRSGNSSSCLLTGPEGSYDDTSVAISDDRTRTFTITIKRLQLKDSGWYWCSAGQQKTAVHVLVTPRPSTTALVTTPFTPSQSDAHQPPPKSIKQSWNSHRHILESLLVCASLMLLVGMVLLARKLWRSHNVSQHGPKSVEDISEDEQDEHWRNKQKHKSASVFPCEEGQQHVEEIEKKVEEKEEVEIENQEKKAEIEGEKKEAEVEEKEQNEEVERAKSVKGKNGGKSLRGTYKKRKRRRKRRRRNSAEFSADYFRALRFPNTGQLCYMNSSLQSLLTLTHFIQDINSQEVSKGLNPGAELLSCFMNIRRCRSSKDTKSKLSATLASKRLISRKAPEFDDDQKDAHEFVTTVIDQIRNLSQPLQKYADFNGSKYKCPVETNRKFFMENTVNCSYGSVREESFTSLSLDVVKNLSVQDRLHNYQKEEDLEYSCDFGGNTSSQKCAFRTLPNIQILHLKRFRYTPTFRLVKVHDSVRLCKNLTLSTNQTETSYSLVSGIRHTGK